MVLRRVDGHAVFVNERALEIAGISEETPNPEGGRIVRDTETGEATGVLVDGAIGLVTQHIPAPDRDERRAAILAAIAECQRWGLTSIHDAGVGLGTIEIYKELAAEGLYGIRNYVMISSDDRTLGEFFASGPEIGLYDDRLTFRAVKIVADGALGSRGAALLEDYSDEPGHTGDWSRRGRSGSARSP